MVEVEEGLKLLTRKINFIKLFFQFHLFLQEFTLVSIIDFFFQILGLSGRSRRHSGPARDGRLSRNGQENGRLWRLLASLLQPGHGRVSVHLQGKDFFKIKTVA